MGSVQTNIECPECKSMECIEDFYYKSNEIHTFCSNCGYFKEHYIKRDKKGFAIKDSEGNPIYIHNEGKGSGVVKLSKKGVRGIQTLYSIPYDEKQRKEFFDGLEKYKKENPNVNVEINKYKP